MKNKLSELWVIAFFILLLADLVALTINLPAVHIWTKPLLMPILVIYLYYSLWGSGSKTWYLTLAGIILAWAGDVFLLFENTNPSFFLFGLASFLGTHICYILLFSRLKKNATNWWAKNAWLWLSVVAFGVILITILWETLGGMKIPVCIYACCISVMVILSLRLQPGMPKTTWIYFSIGAYLFFISDSILAINKFFAPVEIAGPAIMLTYGVAQYLITAGTVKYFGSIKRGAPATPGE